MDKDPKVWKEMAGALAILAGVTLILQSQMAEPALSYIVGGVVLGAVGVWLLLQASRETPS